MTEKKKIFWKTIFPYIAAVLLGIFLSFILFTVKHPAIVCGDSMKPTFHDGDILECTNEFTKDTLLHGDVIVFRHQFRSLIKRIIAVPGDTVGIKDGVVYVNGKKYDELQYDRIIEPGILAEGTITLNQDEYFCLGDNRNNSSDSRKFGAVKYSDIKSKVVRKMYDKENSIYEHKEI